MPLRHVLLFSFGTVLAFAAAPAQAQNTHHQTLAFGDRSLGMGGAFTGLATDQGAAWYNPAGLAFLERDSVSGSLLLHAFEYLRYDGGDLDLETTRRPTFPLFATGVVGVGQRGESHGRHQHAVGIVVVRPLQLRRRFEAEAETALGEPAQLLIDRVHHQTWFGPSWASQLTPRFSIGASLLATVNTFEHREVLIGTTAVAGAAVRSALTEVKSNHLMLRFGGLYAGDRFRFGFLLQPPGAPLREKGIYTDLRALPGRPPVFSSAENADASFPLPAIGRFGASYVLGGQGQYVISGDLQVVLPTPSTRLIDLPAPAEASRSEAAAGSFVDLDTGRNGVVNGAIGFEWRAGRDFLIRVGAYTDLSTARALP
ncbi:MAG: hypothetical protein AAGH15_17415, partial [Myxococcota bacterium]